MSAGESLERGRLERRYRRLLGLYPARHRRVHGEEMLGVLLAAAPDGQRRPRLVEALDLMWSALRIRFRGGPADSGAPADGGWRDALAVFSIAAPVALTIWYAAGWLASLVVYPWAAIVGKAPTEFALGLAYFGLGLALPLVLLRLRRTAAIVCLLATVLLGLLNARDIYNDMNSAYGGLVAGLLAFPLFAYATEAGALLAPAGPRRGLELLTRRRWTLIVAAAIALGFVYPALNALVRLAGGGSRHLPGALLQVPSHPAAVPVAILVAGVIIVAAAISRVARSRRGRRVLVLLAIPAYPVLGIEASVALSGPLGVVLLYLPPLLIAGLVVLAARRARRAGTDGADGGQSATA
jgi:hypothetical protein